MESRSLSDVGGTPGGLGHFLIGFAMTCVGGYVLSNQVSVVGSYWSFYGGNTFGITLLPMLIGVGVLFWNGRSLVGWLLTIAGALFILGGVIANMHIYFRPTSLFNTLVMLIAVCGWAWIHGASTPVVSWAEHRVITSIETERLRNILLAHKHCIQWIR